ncbi:prephenate dehydratase [Lutimonas zeaxanthinifaciens]|uniref:prephenate dehydratase n=1 Tax=Lutimonas zeaxanthinifaciens TaxID=3060215 RepID=UPI00265D040C|nr:prephenate dehydratase [Lutimonas sp. YSD2104]WKK66095.1 prephenate dehydratase [Lutimonas sp. YSD2104]
MRIAIQGIKGSFHHIVANKYFGSDIELVECMSFTEIPLLLENDEVDSAVMAIENSIAGAILPNYALIDEYNLSIEGEYFTNIHHHLMALDGQELKDVKEVWSHPMALLQCRKFFRERPEIKLIEEKDTAEVARRIQKENIKGVAAIASKMAADMYGLKVVADDIQTIKNNSTRFFILKKNNDSPYHPSKLGEIKDKASLKFVTKHDAGSLAEILDIFGKHDLNLTKIQSLPIIEKPWNYAFFIDLVIDDFVLYKNALHLISKKVTHLKILGEYHQNNAV